MSQIMWSRIKVKSLNSQSPVLTQGDWVSRCTRQDGEI